MLCREIIETIERDYPREYALPWDNVGLLIGRDDKEVKRIYVALDATDEVIEDAIHTGADMLVTHHPMIFEGMKRINNRDFTGARAIRLIQQDISCYAMHTNYDVLGMAELSGRRMNLENMEVLDVTCEERPSEGIGRIGELQEQMTLKECCKKVKKVFDLDSVKVFGELDASVKVAAICPGSGKSVVKEAIAKGADVFITGDIGHHEGIDAKAQGLSIIDAGHYGLEHIFIADMKGYFESNLEGVEVMAAPISHPFIII